MDNSSVNKTMAPTLEEAENYVKSVKIDEKTIEKLGEMLISSMDDWQLTSDEKTAESIWVILTEAGRKGKLSDNLGDSDVAKSIERVFEKIRPKLHDQLKSIRWNYDEIVDFDVMVAKNNKSSFSINRPALKTTLNLKILPSGSTEVQVLSVDFDDAQLEDFIFKLREATSMKQRIQQRTAKTRYF